MKYIGFLLVFALIMGLIIYWPYAIIWSLNTLFGFTIPYVAKSWLAIVILMSVFGAGLVKIRS